MNSTAPNIGTLCAGKEGPLLLLEYEWFLVDEQFYYFHAN